jgi:hypothetical protein
MTHLPGRSRAAEARGPIHFRERFSKNHFHESLSKKNRQFIPDQAEFVVRRLDSCP